MLGKKVEILVFKVKMLVKKVNWINFRKTKVEILVFSVKMLVKNSIELILDKEIVELH